MTVPKVQTVNVVTMEHGRKFAEEWVKVSAAGACGETKIMTWPEWDADQQASFREMEDDICGRVFEATREYVAETFVRIANAVIEKWRARPDEPLVPPRVETVEVVTLEHGNLYAEQIYWQMNGSEIFTEALSRTHVMTWPDGGEGASETEAQKHFNELEDEIRDRIHEETKAVIAEAFVRIAGDVTSRERRRR